jgi:hypothetical protein
MKNPIVDEIRQYRNEHSKKFGYDLDAICADYKLHQLKVDTSLRPKLMNRPHRQTSCPESNQ